MQEWIGLFVFRKTDSPHSLLIVGPIFIICKHNIHLHVHVYVFCECR